MAVTKKVKDRKIEPGDNLYIDRLLAIHPDDSEIFKIGDKIVIRPKGTTLEEAQDE